MKKVLKVGLVVAAVVGATASGPAYARGDGETGYAIGCLIGWWVFGLHGICQEMQS